jgi:hypothetical protein
LGKKRTLITNSSKYVTKTALKKQNQELVAHLLLSATCQIARFILINNDTNGKKSERALSSIVGNVNIFSSVR